MTETMARPQPTKPLVAWPLYAVAAVVGLAALVTLNEHLAPLEMTDFRVRNDTVWDLTLVIQTDEDSVMSVAMIEAEDERRITEVIVPGETWRFVWRFAGDDVGTSIVRDEDLRRSAFRLEVPSVVQERLRADGAPPSP